MKKIKNILSGFYSVVEESVGKLENHEAAIEQTVVELERTKIKVSQQIAGLGKIGESLKSDINKTKIEGEKWRKRAKELKDLDRSKAIECLKRSQQEGSKLELLIPQYERLEIRVLDATNNLEKITLLLNETKQRKSELSAKASLSHAAKIGTVQGGLNRDLEKVFNRWEIQIGETNFESNFNYDSFKNDFEKQENQLELEKELNEL
jgi:phage shock protein A